jgi:hypothetical protein
MKNRLLYLLFFFSLQNLSAQQVQWFAPGASWEYFYLTNGSTGYSSMYIDSTIVIGGENCFKLSGYDNGQNFITNEILNEEILPIYAFSRNDSVMIWSFDHFEVLYDFTRQVGDTIPLILFYDYAVLEETGDTLLWNGINTRYQKWIKYNVNFSETSYVFEGLGGESFNYWKFISPGAELASKITCYRDDVHPNPSCTFTLKDESPNFAKKILLYPNPVTNFFKLDLPSEILPATLIITDVLGRKINSFSQTENSQRFDFQDDRLKSGLYFLEIKGKNGVVLTRKFIH